MKRTSLAVLMIALAIVALAAPAAFAQAPAPKVTINGLIDNLTSYSENTANYSGGVLNRRDNLWYARTRGRFDFIGEVGKAKGVLGIELDHVYGQAGSSDTTILGGVHTGFGTDGSFDLNTDSRGIIEIKWLYVEFPVPLIPVPTTARLGAQPFGAVATYKLAAYAAGDFPGVNITSQVAPNVKLIGTFVQLEEGLVGGMTKTNKPLLNSTAQTQDRGDDMAGIFSAEVTPFKGLDIKPMYSIFYAQGTTNGQTRAGRGGLTTSTPYQPTGTVLGGIEEWRNTVGVDARLRMGPFSLDPTVMYQFGKTTVVAPGNFAASGAVPGRKYRPELNAWLIDVRAGYQLGPLLIQGLAMYTTGNSRRNNALGTVRYYQPLSTDTGYLADWGTNLTSLGIDYLNAYNEANGVVPYMGAAIGYDKYGRMQLGGKVTYAITPALSISADANTIWTAEKVERSGTLVSGGGILPQFAGTPNRSPSRHIGEEINLLVSWKFAPGLAWDNQAGYLFPGAALDGDTSAAQGAQNTKAPFMLTSRIRFTF